MAKKKRVVRKQTQSIVSDEIFIPNHSGMLDAGEVHRTPTDNLDPVNKKYVDDSIHLDDGTAQGQMAFWDATLGKWVKTETSELFWDDTNKRFGIGTTNPGCKLDVYGRGITSNNTGAGALLRVNRTDGQIAVLIAGGSGTGFKFDQSGAFEIEPLPRATIEGVSFPAFSKGFQVKGNGDVDLNSGDLFNDQSTGNIGIGTTTPDEKLEVVGNVKASGYVTGKKCGVFASLNAPTNTTVTTAGTYYPILGTFTNSPIEDFGAATAYTPGIKYTGTKTQYFEVDWHATGSGDSAGITTHIGIKKNNVLVSPSVMGTFLKFTGEKQALSGTCVVELATNDEIQLVITADGNGDVITINQFTTTITEFFD